MIDPTNGGQWDVTDPRTSVLDGHQPSHYDNRYTGTWDNGGVHINSGIINHLFYLLTVGGTHAISGISVTGIGQSAAEKMLFKCMIDNLVGNPSATFLDFREEMLDVCKDLFPTDLDKLTQVKNAFNAVGIGPDMYVRDNVLDTGEEPYGGSYLYASPDIINRTSPSSNPAVDFADLSNDSLWENVEAGQDNYVYIRLQNRGNQDGDATVNVYFSPASTFASPSGWTHIGTLVETGITPGSVRVSGPLLFPSTLIPALGHYCMIAVVSNPADPAPDHTLISSISDYLNFVRGTNNIAYRNMNVVDLIPGTPGVFKFKAGALGGGVREKFDLRFDFGRFVPGAKVQIRGPALALDGAIARGLKLVARKRNQNLYRVMAGRELEKHERFVLPGMRDERLAFGFDNVAIDKDLQLEVVYILPEADVLRQSGHKIRRNPYQLVVRQLWKGEIVGAVGLQVKSPLKVKRRRRPRRKLRRK